MNQVYLVEASEGEYDDTYEWIAGAFIYPENAERFQSRVYEASEGYKKLGQEVSELYDALDWENFDEEKYDAINKLYEEGCRKLREEHGKAAQGEVSYVSIRPVSILDGEEC